MDPLANTTQTHPNILIVTTDGHRRDALGCLHRDPVFTPHLDAFAKEGVLCTQTVTNSPLCTPARACLLTGKHPGTLTGNPPQVNMLYNWQRLPVEEETFAKAANRAGYDTALIGKWHVDDYEEGDHGNMWSHLTPPGPRRMGFRYWYSNGCCHDHFRLCYNDTEGQVHDLGQGWQVDHETGKAQAYLRNDNGERPTEKPFCLWLNWSPPHNQTGGEAFDPEGPEFQYAAPDADMQIYRDPLLPLPHPATRAQPYRQAAPGYYGMVTNLDRAFGRLMNTLEEAGLRENTIVVYTSDHGEMLGIQGRWIKDVWHEQSIGVPCILRWPGHIPSSLRCNSVFGLVDLAPSLLAMAGVEMEAGRHGRDVSEQWLSDGQQEDESQLICFNTGAPPAELSKWDFPDEAGRAWRGIRTPTHTYIVVDQRPGGTFKFYDKDRFDDAFPPEATRAAWNLKDDPQQCAPIYPGQGQDALLDQLHDLLQGKLEEIGDDFLKSWWTPQRGNNLKR